jgi:hypothetical protein
MNQFPVKTEINNGALSTINAMPQKGSNSNGDSSFELARAIYVQTNALVSKTPTYQNNQKKWLGNRDASQVTANRRNNGIGKGSINTSSSNTLSFTSFRDVNVVSDALTRCRSGGSTVPKKCQHSKF